jgi:hypothetical protein
VKAVASGGVFEMIYWFSFIATYVLGVGLVHGLKLYPSRSKLMGIGGIGDETCHQRPPAAGEV